MSQPEITLKQEKLRVLNLEDSPSDSVLIKAALKTDWKELEFLCVDTRETFVQALLTFKANIIIADFNLPDISGREALSFAHQNYPDIPVIIVSGALADIEAVDLIKQGAKDYVMKDKLYRLSAAVRNALLQEQGVRARKAAERALLESEANMRALIEHSPVAMIVDTGLGESEKVTMLNQRFTQLFGYTLEDIPDVSHWWPLAYPDKDYREKLQTEFNILAH
jgi:DNA-binding NtrC family response regulator